MKKEKYCKVCGETKESKFYPSRKNKCKSCISNEYKTRTDKQDYFEKQNEWKRNNFLRFQILQAKYRAKRDNRKFELTDTIMIDKLKEQKECCYISKLPISFYPKNPYSLSIDRIDSTKDYTIDNTIIVTKFVNNCKNTLSMNDFIKYLKEVCENLE